MILFCYYCPRLHTILEYYITLNILSKATCGCLNEHLYEMAVIGQAYAILTCQITLFKALPLNYCV